MNLDPKYCLIIKRLVKYSFIKTSLTRSVNITNAITPSFHKKIYLIKNLLNNFYFRRKGD